MSSDDRARTIALLLNDAQDALDSGDWQTARARAATVISLDPANELAQRIAELALVGQSGRIIPGQAALGSNVLDPHRLGHAVARVAELATLSPLALRILSAASEAPIGASDLARMLAPEPAVAATVLRVANSAHYPHPTPVASIREAITVLGVREVESLALTAAVTASLPNGTVVGRYDFWRFSLCVATIAATLEQESGTSSWAFAAGLLHNIGLLALDLYSPQELRVAVALQRHDARPLPDREREVFGFTDADLGAALARRWSLPARIVEVLEQLPVDDRAQTSQLATWILQARTRAHNAGISDGMDDTIADSPPRETSQPARSSALGDAQQITSRAAPFLAAIRQRDEPLPSA